MKSTTKKFGACLLAVCVATLFVNAKPAEASIGGVLTVVNHTPEAQVVYYEGVRVGIAPANGFVRIPIGDWSGGLFNLRCRGVFTGFTRSQVFGGNYNYFTWTI